MTPDEREVMRKAAFRDGLIVGTLGAAILFASILVAVLS